MQVISLVSDSDSDDPPHQRAKSRGSRSGGTFQADATNVVADHGGVDDDGVDADMRMDTAVRAGTMKDDDDDFIPRTKRKSAPVPVSAGIAEHPPRKRRSTNASVRDTNGGGDAGGGGGGTPGTQRGTFMIPTPSSCVTRNAPHEEEIAEIESEMAAIDAQVAELMHRRRALESRRHSLLSRASQRVSQALKEREGPLDLAALFPWTEKVVSVAKSVFGIHSFRKNQLEAINALLMKRDVMCILPTGGGKSLIYQLAAVIQPGVTLVVSPLISLIQDQVMQLRELRIGAEYLTAGTPKDEVRRIYADTLDPEGKTKLLYVTPEKIVKSKLFLSHLEKLYNVNRVNAFVIDEAHCCSQYGHDYRPDYKKLSILRTLFPDIPIIGLTATCPPEIMSSVLEILGLRAIGTHHQRGTILLSSPLNRPNLRYIVRPKPSAANSAVKEIASFIRENYNKQRGIIYALTKKDTDNLASALLENGLDRVAVYNADLDDATRTSVHARWRRGEILVVVATIAFGMGINEPRCRFVLHHTVSKSLEGYFQESGRAGRDGQTADCVLFYRSADIARVSTMVFQDHNGVKGLYGMISYAENVKECRRAVFARYFGDREWDEPSHGADGTASGCGMCDVCTRDSAEWILEAVDVTEAAYQFCLIIKTLVEEENAKITLLKATDIWRGVGGKFITVTRLADRGVVSLPPTGLNREEQERIIVHLLLEQYIEEDFHFTAYQCLSYLKLGKRGERLVTAQGRNFRVLVDFVRRVKAASDAKRKRKSSAVTAHSSVPLVPRGASPAIISDGEEHTDASNMIANSSVNDPDLSLASQAKPVAKSGRSLSGVAKRIGKTGIDEMRVRTTKTENLLAGQTRPRLSLPRRSGMLASLPSAVAGADGVLGGNGDNGNLDGDDGELLFGIEQEDNGGSGNDGGDHGPRMVFLFGE